MSRLTVEQINALPFYDLADPRDSAGGYVVGMIGDVTHSDDWSFMIALLVNSPGKFELRHAGAWSPRCLELFRRLLSRSGCASRFVLCGSVTNIPEWLGSVGLLVIRSDSKEYTETELTALACGRSVVKTTSAVSAAHQATCELEGWSGGWARKNREEAKLVAEGKL